MEWTAVATARELGRRRKLRVEIDGTAIALFQTEGRVYAFADLCVHQDRSLFKGTLLHGKVICPGHQWQFDLETGYEADQDLCQPTYPVRVDDDGTIYVNLAPESRVPARTEEEAPDMTPRTIVTVGAGQAAAVAARNLRRQGFDGRIMLIGDEPHAPYQRPPLSKEFLAGTDSEAALWILRPSWIADNDVEIVTGTGVLRVDPVARTVELDSGSEIVADAVLFATGGTPRTLPVPGPRPDLVHYLRTLDDALRLAPVLVPGRRLAIIGAGFIGLEIAATAAAAGVAVTVFESVPVPLARILGVEMGQAVSLLHRDNGVDLRTGVRLAGIRTTADGVLIDMTDAAAPFEADAVVIGIGITPNTAAAEATGLRIEDGIVVDALGRSTIPNIYAAGDVARRYSERAGRHVRLEHFDNASRQGVAVSNAMLGRDAPSDDAPWFWSDQHGRNLQFVGAATGEPVIRGDLGALDFTGFYLEGATVRGAFTIDRGEDIMAVRELLGREVDIAALRDEDTDLWDLAYADIDEESQVQQ